REGDKRFWNRGNDLAGAIAILLDSVAETEIGKVDEGQRASAGERGGNLIPLLVGKVSASRVVAAAVQQHDIAGAQLVQRGKHLIELHATGRDIEIGVSRGLETRLDGDRVVVGPGRIGHVDRRTGAGTVDQLHQDPERTGAAG